MPLYDNKCCVSFTIVPRNKLFCVFLEILTVFWHIFLEHLSVFLALPAPISVFFVENKSPFPENHFFSSQKEISHFQILLPTGEISQFSYMPSNFQVACELMLMFNFISSPIFTRVRLSWTRIPSNFPDALQFWWTEHAPTGNSCRNSDVQGDSNIRNFSGFGLVF